MYTIKKCYLSYLTDNNIVRRNMLISNLISKVADKNSSEIVNQINNLICDSDFGILVKAVGSDEILVDVRAVLKKEDLVVFTLVTTPKGNIMIKACADPYLFLNKYPKSFNLIKSGKEILELAIKHPDAEGVLFCSATEFVSYALFKKEIIKILKKKSNNFKKKWWQFWL